MPVVCLPTRSMQESYRLGCAVRALLQKALLVRSLRDACKAEKSNVCAYVPSIVRPLLAREAFFDVCHVASHRKRLGFW